MFYYKYNRSSPRTLHFYTLLCVLTIKGTFTLSTDFLSERWHNSVMAIILLIVSISGTNSNIIKNIKDPKQIIIIEVI